MMVDVLVLFKLLKYLPELDGYGWVNTWIPNYDHDPLLTSIQLDQVLITLFIERTLKGLFVDEPELRSVSKQFYEKLKQNCELLGCTLEQIRSAQKLEAFLEKSNIAGMAECLDGWPRTPTGNICLGADDLHISLVYPFFSFVKYRFYTIFDKIKNYYKSMVYNRKS